MMIAAGRAPEPPCFIPVDHRPPRLAGASLDDASLLNRQRENIVQSIVGMEARKAASQPRRDDRMVIGNQ
jgi:hypothetical protein